MTVSLQQQSERVHEREAESRKRSEAILNQFQRLLLGDSNSLLLQPDLPIRNALRQALSYYDLSIPASLRVNLSEQEPGDALATVGLIAREIELPDNWQGSDYGLLLFIDASDNCWIAQQQRGRMKLFDAMGQQITVTQDFLLEKKTFAVYPTLPAKPLTLWEWLTFGNRWVRKEVMLFVLMTVLTSIFAMLLPVLSSTIISDVVPNSDFALLSQLAFLLILVVLFQGAADYFSAWLELRMRTKNGLILQAALINRVIAYATEVKNSATRLSLQMQYAESLRSGLTSALMTGFTGLSYFVASIVIMFVYQPAGALIVSISALMLLLVLAGFGWSAIAILKEGQAQETNSADILYDIMSNLTIIKAFGLERQFFTRWSENYALSRQKMMQSRQRTRFATALKDSWSMLLMGLGYGAVAISGIDPTQQGQFISFATALSSALVGLNLLASALQSAIHTLPYRGSVAKLLEFNPPSPSFRVAPRLQGAIRVSHVHQRYLTDGPEVLKDINFSITPSEYVGIVGASGSGKSSLLKVLIGLLQPQSGDVLFDDRAIEEMDTSALRRQVGVVMQEQTLVPGSLYENIAGLRQLTMDQVWKAAELAAIADEIRALPMGMYTMVNDANEVFSGGQIQRIALARALAADSPILILDEATSAVDNATQDTISNNLRQLDNTRLVIAHRLSTVRHCDRILVLNRGQLVQTGTWRELAEQDGLFKEFLRLE